MTPAYCWADLRAWRSGSELFGKVRKGCHAIFVRFKWLGDGAQGIDAQDQKTCDTDEGGCGQLWPIQRFLEGDAAPVFTLQLAWESHAESSEAIAEVLDAVQEVRSPRQALKGMSGCSLLPCRAPAVCTSAGP